MPLSRDRVLGAALDLLDEEGLDRLTMRRVADRLAVRHGTLYWHFADKQALLDAMAERILDGVADFDDAAAPIAQLAELASRLREALLSRRDGARVVAGTYVTEPNTLQVGERGVRAGIAAGASERDAVLLAFALQEYVLGHTIEEQSRGPVPGGEDPDAPPPVDAERYPALSAAVSQLAGEARARDGFAFGLELMLAGVRARYGCDGVDGPEI